VSARGLLVRSVASGLDRTGLMPALAHAAGYARRAPAFPVLTYHRVNDDRDPFFESVPTRVFEAQIAHIARTYSVLTVEDLVARMKHGRVPRNAVAITFDDGYRDNLTHAAPILTRHGVRATFFLATGFISTAEIPWYDRLAQAFKLTTRSSIETPGGAAVSLATTAERLAALASTLSHLKSRPDEEARRTMDALLDTLSVTDSKAFKNLMLSWDDVHALTGLGFSIGAHTVNHPILSRVSAQRAWTEILGSRTMIETALGHAPSAFAYPNGRAEDYTATVTSMVREAGFTCALTTRFGLNTAATSPWQLRRGGPWEDHSPTFALKLAWYRLRLA
jgi:peptidoglycan/xylan/chitin deacetylase (PgdA/CDA1 family)